MTVAKKLTKKARGAAKTAKEEAENLHVTMLDNARMVVMVPQAPIQIRIEALSILLGAYTDRGVA